MNIERFIAARKKLGLSQSELAEGICTQATLSRFENNGQVPTLKILLKLCERLDLSLGDLFPKVQKKDSEVNEKMDRVEFYLITSEYEHAQEILESITSESIEDEIISLRYYYLKGFLAFYLEKSIIDVRFIFDNILLQEETPETKIFHLLAYVGVGMIYSQENENEKAEFYFNKVLSEIYELPIEKIEDTWRILHILYQCGVFYSKINELSSSDALLNYAITICSDNHVTYYLARAAIQLAKNAIEAKKDREVIYELMNDARAYSKINRNYMALKELSEMEALLKEGQ